MPVSCVHFQKHFGTYLDEKLNLNYHVKEKICEAMQEIGVTRKLSKVLPWNYLITLYKSLVRPHLNYSNVFYDQPNNEKFCQKTGSVQCTLAIREAIKGTYISDETL